MSDNTDSLDQFLTTKPLPIDPGLRDDVLAQTLPTVRRRRYLKRAGLVAALAACFAAGAFTMHLVTPAVEPEVRIVERFVEPKAIPAPTPQVASAIVEQQAASALALEWQAVENPERGAELFRRAGDRYLNDESDMESAVRCYKNALNAATAEDLQITPQDNWLLISLKNARQEEHRHGKSDG